MAASRLTSLPALDSSHVSFGSSLAASSRLERRGPKSLGGVSLGMPATMVGMPDIVKCSSCAGQGSRGFFVCKSFCHACVGTGEASKTQLLQLLQDMRLGDVDAAVVLHAVSAEKRDDEEIALAAVGRFPKALQFVSERLQASQEILDTAAAAEAALKKKMSQRPWSRETSRETSRDYSTMAPSRSSTSSPSILEPPPQPAENWGSFCGEESA